MPQKHGKKAIMMTEASPRMAPSKYRVSYLIEAMFFMGVAGLGVNAPVGTWLVAGTVLLFEATFVVKGGLVGVGKLTELVDSAELFDGAEVADEEEAVVVVVTNNFSWPAVTV